jgi:hypothetical protein
MRNNERRGIEIIGGRDGEERVKQGNTQEGKRTEVKRNNWMKRRKKEGKM